ncbi:MAG TPA: MgtC/SapB family protein [Dehalococcoidia bacterium]|nr:MgtC/SapB family protein [Dehalococcoidia bacterium]
MIDTGTQFEIVGRIALAAVLGGMIGLEREYRGYPAGVRTMALVCMGSAIFADMSRLYGGDDRIAAGIVSGIGFLGAGLIFREGYSVKGVTTAATIWAAAAVGVALGIEAYVVAVFGALFAVILLELRVVTKNLRPAGRNGLGDPEDNAREPDEWRRREDD